MVVIFIVYFEIQTFWSIFYIYKHVCPVTTVIFTGKNLSSKWIVTPSLTVPVNVICLKSHVNIFFFIKTVFISNGFKFTRPVFIHFFGLFFLNNVQWRICVYVSGREWRSCNVFIKWRKPLWCRKQLFRLCWFAIGFPVNYSIFFVCIIKNKKSIT